MEDAIVALDEAVRHLREAQSVAGEDDTAQIAEAVRLAEAAAAALRRKAAAAAG